MVVIQTLFTNLTPLYHICLMVCSLTVIYDWFPVILRKSWRVPHVGRKFLLFPEHLLSLPLYLVRFILMILLIRYIYICIAEFVSFRTMFTEFNDWFVCLYKSGCFVSDHYFIIAMGKTYYIILYMIHRIGPIIVCSDFQINRYKIEFILCMIHTCNIGPINVCTDFEINRYKIDEFRKYANKIRTHAQIHTHTEGHEGKVNSLANPFGARLMNIIIHVGDRWEHLRFGKKT